MFTNFCLQVGQFLTFGLQLGQMLCPLAQNTIGGSMYSVQTGHSSSLSRPSLRSQVTLFIAARLVNVWNMRCKQIIL